MSLWQNGGRDAGRTFTAWHGISRLVYDAKLSTPGRADVACRVVHVGTPTPRHLPFCVSLSSFSASILLHSVRVYNSR